MAGIKDIRGITQNKLSRTIMEVLKEACIKGHDQFGSTFDFSPVEDLKIAFAQWINCDVSLI